MYTNLQGASVRSSQTLLRQRSDTIDIGATSTGDSLQTATCSTCEVQEDKSAYWTPSLYYQHPNGTFESVPNDGMTVYYVGR